MANMTSKTREREALDAFLCAGLELGLNGAGMKNALRDVLAEADKSTINDQPKLGEKNECSN